MFLLWTLSAFAQPDCTEPDGLKGSRFRVGRAPVAVEATEKVQGITVLGSSARVDGIVLGPVFVMGGSITLGPCAVVYGALTAIGGRIEAAPGARWMNGRTEILAPGRSRAWEDSQAAR